MNIFEEYMQKKKELEEIRNKMMNILRNENINSVETFLVLKILFEHPELTQREVSNLTDISPGSVANIIISLVDKGYITNEKNANDFTRRTIKRKLLNLTEQGTKVYNNCMKWLGNATE